jgi:hypothetical protein
MAWKRKEDEIERLQEWIKQKLDDMEGIIQV